MQYCAETQSGCWGWPADEIPGTVHAPPVDQKRWAHDERKQGRLCAKCAASRVGFVERAGSIRTQPVVLSDAPGYVKLAANAVDERQSAFAAEVKLRFALAEEVARHADFSHLNGAAAAAPDADARADAVAIALIAPDAQPEPVSPAV